MVGRGDRPRLSTVPHVLAVNRFRATAATAAGLRADLERVRELFMDRPGCVAAWLGRNLDDPELWVLTSRWADLGSYRRALSSYDGKLLIVPVLAHALDEPGAYEVVEPGAELNVARSRGD